MLLLVTYMVQSGPVDSRKRAAERSTILEKLAYLNAKLREERIIANRFKGILWTHKQGLAWEGAIRRIKSLQREIRINRARLWVLNHPDKQMGLLRKLFGWF